MNNWKEWNSFLPGLLNLLLTLKATRRKPQWGKTLLKAVINTGAICYGILSKPLEIRRLPAD